jgi:hypothetical protein
MAYHSAKLDAYYARLYGLTRDELRYILALKDVYGDDFPGETFRVLKEKENKQYGNALQSDEKVGGTWRSGMSKAKDEG